MYTSSSSSPFKNAVVMWSWYHSKSKWATLVCDGDIGGHQTSFNVLDSSPRSQGTPSTWLSYAPSRCSLQEASLSTPELLGMIPECAAYYPRLHMGCITLAGRFENVDNSEANANRDHKALQLYVAHYALKLLKQASLNFMTIFSGGMNSTLCRPNLSFGFTGPLFCSGRQPTSSPANATICFH